MEEITRVFPGVRANDGVSFDLRSGEIHALVGENGADKTTLMKILYGLQKPDSGTIYLRGQAAAIRNPRDAIAQGIGMVHQHFMLVPPFRMMRRGPQARRAGARAHKIEEIMNANGLPVDLEATVENLPVGTRQRVEILKILYRGAEILVFDEPTTVLTLQEVEELFKTFRMMRRQGKGINVYLMRYAGVILSGVMCGLAAAVLYPSKWVNGMVAGRGFIALAALIFGRWHPVGAALAGMTGRARPPAADGIPYEPGE